MKDLAGLLVGLVIDAARSRRAVDGLRRHGGWNGAGRMDPECHRKREPQVGDRDRWDRTESALEDKTFTQAVGVWTKADSVTRFDDFAYGGR